MPYGFPSGAGLRRLLCNAEYMLELTRYGDYSEREIRRFCDVFLKSGMASIDAFLARRGEHEVFSDGRTFSEIGKAGIAFSLIRCENSHKLFDFDINDHWYQYLWQFIGDSLDDIGKNQLSIITFNYDRSLEMYLLLAIQHAFGVSEDEAAYHLKKIPITHVYGQIGDLMCLSGSEDNSRSYAPDTSSRNVATGAAGIKVIAEHREDGPEFAKAHAAIAEAERICFLGFGFDTTNVRRLDIEQLLKTRFEKSWFASPLTYASTLGMLHAERQSVIRLLSPAWRPTRELSPSGINLERTIGKIKGHILDAADQPNTNYLRHTGVLNGSE
jgi:hypothetical protein